MIELTENILDPEKITAQVRRDTNGSVITFLGTTRDLSLIHISEPTRPY